MTDDNGRKKPSFAARGLAGGRRYGAGFATEVILFYAILVAYEQLGYGRRLTTSPPFTGPTVYFVIVGLAMVVLAMGAAEARFRLYRRVWAVAGVKDAFAIGLAVLEAAVLITIANAAIPGDYRPYRFAVPLLAAPTVAVALGLFRMISRVGSGLPRAERRLLIVADGDNWHATVKALVQYPHPDWLPEAILASNPREFRRTVMGIPVLGATEDLARWIRETEPDGVAFVTNHRPNSDLQELFMTCLRHDLPIFIVPDVLDLLRPGEAGRLRPLATDDLVGRATRDIEVQAARPHIQGKTVMITGAAGSIGSQLCRLLARLGPARLVLVDNNESGLFDIAVDLRASGATNVREALVSVSDRDLLANVFAEETPDIVFHTAAYKHVPLLEDHPEQAVLNNVLGTRNALQCAEAAGVKQFVLISSDKAVARHSVMGATKRICEQLVLNYKGPMDCWGVRFGNVIGSRGSVLPTFERQINAGGPVTITHPEMTRYMMTITEAATLVISTLGIGSNGRLFMLDMGEPISILSLAHSLIRSRGLRPEIDIPVVVTGLRPGERLTEELLFSHEGTRKTAHASILEVVTAHHPDAQDIAWIAERLVEMAHKGDSSRLVRSLKQSVEAVPTEQREDSMRPAAARRPTNET